MMRTGSEFVWNGTAIIDLGGKTWSYMVKNKADQHKRIRRAPRRRRGLSLVARGSKPTLEEIRQLPLLSDDRKYWRWACKRYGKPFMMWVQENWITANEREIQVMHRAWIAAGGSPG